MTLMLHAGANPVDYAGLRELETPVATDTHVPVPHFRLVDLIFHSLGYYGHEIVQQDFGVTPDGMKFFGVLTLRSPHTGWSDVVGLRNSHDKSLPVGVSFGSSVFVCDNLAFSGDFVIKTKHSAKLKMRLPGLIGELIEPIAEQREGQQKKLLGYQETALTDELADHAIMSMYREGVINLQRIADVHDQWQAPTHDWGDKTAWRLFNAATFALTGKVMEKPAVTTQLHKVIDGVCERIH
jgi:hypothetical protein